jgi:hypothetical protein
LVYEAAFNAADATEQKLIDAAAEDIRVAHAFWNRLSSKQQQRVAGGIGTHGSSPLRIVRLTVPAVIGSHGRPSPDRRAPTRESTRHRRS